MRRLIATLMFALVLVGPAFAVNPDEELSDPALETRAREISEGIRCLVCQNQDIDNSNAGLAHDLRVLIRERLTKGDTDDEVRQYLVDRYGEFVLLLPRFNWHTWILWMATPIVFLIGAFAIWRGVKRPANLPGTALNEEEERALSSLRDEDA